MWSRLDDGLIDHPKIFRAAELLANKDGAAIVLGFFSVCLMYSNKHLTDGFVPTPVLRSFGHVEQPLVVADALTRAGLFDPDPQGIRIHDFGKYNKAADKVKQAREDDRRRKLDLT